MQTAFDLGNLVALVGWAMLLAAPYAGAWRARLRAFAGRVVPAVLAAGYVGMVAARWGTVPDAGFTTLAGVRALFADDGVLVAGWLHYLAFDLFVGAWIGRAGEEAGLSPLLLAPCLVLTFVAGPAGLLAFLALRALAGRRAAAP